MLSYKTGLGEEMTDSYWDTGCFDLYNLNLIQKVPHNVQKKGGGVEATFGQCPKDTRFFSDVFPMGDTRISEHSQGDSLMGQGDMTAQFVGEGMISHHDIRGQTDITAFRGGRLDGW